MDSLVRALVMNMVRGILPYPEPFRRRRVRAAARSLVTCESWPDDDETTAADVAQLAMLRLLWLQRETRRAASGRHREASVLLARAAVEGCLLGLYCLHKPDVVARLKAANIKAMGDVVGYFVDDGFVSKGAVDESLASFGATGQPLNVRQMAELVDTTLDGAGALSLYRRFYVPTSTFFVHANAASLLRHVGPDDTLNGRPFVPWTRRSAVRISDACVGLLAGALARQADVDTTVFEEYAQAHAARAITPLAVVAGRGLRDSVELAELPAAWQRMLRLRAYAESEQAWLDAPAVREARVRQEFRQILSVLHLDLDDGATAPVHEHFVTVLLERIAEHGAATYGP
ncbi:hypothetical protein [Streptomyces sp. IBSBF 2435]|uniref:hypothetical protein n=1 Tax=Streptomyces sp. IBSBF 2435 TaxID=2903531 RepID=UPI002FDBBDF0